MIMTIKLASKTILLRLGQTSSPPPRKGISPEQTALAFGHRNPQGHDTDARKVALCLGHICQTELTCAPNVANRTTYNGTACVGPFRSLDVTKRIETARRQRSTIVFFTLALPTQKHTNTASDRSVCWVITMYKARSYLL